MAINVSQSFHRTSSNAVDDTLTLTKAEMLAVNDNLMPDKYLTVCQDDGFIYLYDKSATPNSTTGKFTKFESGSGGASALNDLTDVTISSAAQDQILKYNGSGWVNSSVPEDTTKYGTSDSASIDLADADYIPFYDSSASAKKKTLWSNIKTVLANTFQPKLTAGTNITISSNTISASMPAIGTINRSDIYSTTEKVVGCWTDGRPIYQKSISFGALPNNATKSVAHGLTTLRRVIDLKGYTYMPSTGWTSAIPCPSPNSTDSLQLDCDATNINIITKADWSGCTETYVNIWYTKTSDAANSYNYANENDYSTTEKIIGSWLDGKTLYQKSYTLPYTVTTTGSWASVGDVDSNITGMSIKDISGVVARADNLVLSVYGESEDTKYTVRTNTTASKLKFYACTTGSTTNASGTAYITIKYTK